MLSVSTHGLKDSESSGYASNRRLHRVGGYQQTYRFTAALIAFGTRMQVGTTRREPFLLDELALKERETCCLRDLVTHGR